MRFGGRRGDEGGQGQRGKFLTVAERQRLDWGAAQRWRQVPGNAGSCGGSFP